MEDLEKKLRALTEEDRTILSDMLGSMNKEVETKENIQLAGGRGDGVMTIQAHKAYKDATGSSLLEEAPAPKVDTTWKEGEDTEFIKEWKARNKARQDETFQKLLAKRKA